MSEHGSYSTYTNYDCRCGPCKDAARLWQRDYRARNRGAINGNARRYKQGRAQQLRDIKLGRGCADCGYREHPEALDFDHLDGKRFNISKDPGRAWADTLAEIEKCEVVCANCHRVRTARRRAA